MTSRYIREGVQATERWRPAAMLFGLSVMVGMLSGGQVHAQDPFGAGTTDVNPFGAMAPTTAQPDTPFGGFTPANNDTPAATAPEASSTSLENDPNPVVRLLRETPPQTPAEMAQGLSWVVRLKRWDEVRRLLDSVAAKNWSLAELAELAKSGDPSLWLRLSHNEAGLSEPQRQLVDSILAAPGKLASDLAWLDSWIEKLAHPQPGERRLAQLRLQDGGQAAIARLMERLLAGDSSVDKGMLAGTVAGFGAQGVEALKAATLVKDTDRAGRVFLGLAEIPGNAFSAELGAGLASSVISPQIRTELSSVLARRYQKLPTPEAIHDFLIERFRTLLGNYQQTRTSEVPVADIVWRPTADGRSVEPIQATDKDRTLEAVAQLAAHRLNLSLATTEELVDCGAVLLQRAYQVAPEAEQEGLLAEFNHDTTMEPGYWIRVFDRATELQFHGAAVRAIGALADRGPGRYVMPLDFLTRILADSRPIVRYLAMEQLVKVDPQQPFAGQERALEVALEMASLAAGPQALVVGRNAELRSAAEQQLQSQIGAQVTAAHSARAALQVLDGHTPMEMVVIVDRLSDQSLYELVQRVRGSERGSALPIAVLTDELYKHERQMFAETPGVVYSILSRAPAQMQSVTSQLMRLVDTRPFTPQQRTDFALVAIQFLSRVAADRETYAFYPLADWRDELIAVANRLPTMTRVSLLSGLGSRESQQHLLTMAGLGSLASTERLEAARAFETSVERFGLNLGREDVLTVYDTYNVLGPNDPATAQALGMVLDVIEQRATQP